MVEGMHVGRPFVCRRLPGKMIRLIENPAMDLNPRADGLDPRAHIGTGRFRHNDGHGNAERPPRMGRRNAGIAARSAVDCPRACRHLRFAEPSDTPELEAARWLQRLHLEKQGPPACRIGRRRFQKGCFQMQGHAVLLASSPAFLRADEAKVNRDPYSLQEDRNAGSKRCGTPILPPRRPDKAWRRAAGSRRRGRRAGWPCRNGQNRSNRSPKRRQGSP